MEKYQMNIETSQDLPLKVQEYLWQQVGNSLKVKLEAGKYEQTCVAFERLYRDRNKELKISIPEVYEDIKSISRSTFVQGAFPYVIHCCAAILEQRRQLGLTDNLSVAVTKVFSTLHWILLEANQESESNVGTLPLSSIELFIQTLIPNLCNLYETDLTFSLQVGIALWQPLWNHSPPVGSLLALPIVYNNEIAENGKPVRPTVYYFDVALLKVMMLHKWNTNGYRWGLRFIQKHLEQLLLYYGFDEEKSQVLNLIKKFNAKKSSVIGNENVVVERQSYYVVNTNSIPSERHFQHHEKNNLPKSLHQFVSEKGDLKLNYIIRIIERLLASENLECLSGNILFIIAQLIDLRIEPQLSNIESRLDIESLFLCLLNTIKIIGCDHCSTVLKGTKSEHLRALAHIYMRKLFIYDEMSCKEYLIDYVNALEIHDVMSFFHAFMGYCSYSCLKNDEQRMTTQSHKGSFDIDPKSITNYSSYIENKSLNETLLLKWNATVLFQKIKQSSQKLFSQGKSDLFVSLVQLIKYLQQHHHFIFRKIVMSGLLDSFDKSRNVKSPIPEMAGEDSPPGSPTSTLSLDDADGKKSLRKVVIARKPKLLWLWRQKNDLNDSNSSSTNLSNLQHNDSSNSNDSIRRDPSRSMNSSLPRAFISKLPNFDQSSAQKDHSLHSSISEKSLESIGTKRGKLIHIKGLYEGLRQLRCLLQLTPPGMTPEETVVAAMLDLEAPVVSRAAYLLELAYFVHQCNKNYWPYLVQFAPVHATKDDPDASFLKHKAGVLFHKWAVSIGKKLEDILLQERAQTEANRFSVLYEGKNIEFMYQGDLHSVSQYCPHALRYIACQLLFEITSFLRESYVNIAIQLSPPSDSPNLKIKQELTAMKSDASAKKKQSVVSSIGRKISVLNRRKQSNSHLVPLPNTNEQQYSPSKVKKKLSQAGRVTRRKSQVQYSGPRRSSKTSAGIETQPSMSVCDIDENHVIDFPWLSIMIQMNKTADILCNHNANSCSSACPVEQSRTCSSLVDALNTIYSNFVADERDSKEGVPKVDPVGKYLNENVGSLNHIPFSVLCKGARVMDIGQLYETMAFSWEVLLYPDDRLKASATSLFLISGVLSMQMESTISEFLMRQLTSVDVSDRAKAVERLATLWNYQYKVYDHLEDHDKRYLKIALPKVDFTVPSRPVGKDPQLAPDAPWLPNAQNFQDVDLSDDEDDFYFMDSEKQLEQKTKKRAKKLNELKENYMVSAEAFAFQALHKFNIFNTTTEEDQSSSSYQKMKEDAMTINSDCPVQSFFPESIEEGLLQLIRLLDDTSVTTVNNHTVSGLARHVVWKCMVDNPEIFFRRFFEKITVKQHQGELIMLLRKLLVHFPVLPPHTARYLFNNLVGVVSLYNRTNRPYTQDKIAAIMPLFSQIAPSVTRIYFKELQMTLRREQVDDILMVTANGVCAKDIVLYPGKETLQVLENMTFCELLTQAERSDAENLWLVDKHSGQIMENDYRIRDVYTHKRGFPRPALKLERLDETYAFRKREKQALINKIINISQLELCNSIFDTLPNKRHVMFLYTELYQKVSFPRKAIDIEFDLCAGVELGKEIFGMDVTYKDNWVVFISTLLKGLKEFYGEEMINIFLDPINGALLLHCEDVLILRSSLAALISVVIAYEKTFSLDGFSEILPTMLRVYSQHEGNMLVREAIEFTVYQFFFIHRGSFILQMFASVAPILISDNNADIDPHEQIDMVPAKSLFMLLESLDRKHVDTLDILSLVDEDKIKPYADPVNEEGDRSSIDLSIRLALTIISYKSESKRALQMMYVLSTLVPYYLNHLKGKKDGSVGEVDVKKEIKHMRYLTKYVATIIELYEHLRNSIHGVSTSDRPHDATATNNVHWMWTSIQNSLSSFTQWFSSHGREERPEGDDMERASIIEEGENPIIISASNVEQRKKLDEFYLPRTILLTLASDFTLNCTETYNTLRTMQGDVSVKVSNGGFHDVIEDENSLILIDIAISMLKLVFFDHHVLRNPGLERFLIEAMPLINWKDNLEPFSVIIKRMTIIFRIITEKHDYWKYLDWDGLENLIKGLYLTVKRQESIADIAEIKDLLHVCLKVIIADVPAAPSESSISAGVKSISSASFNNCLVKLSARLLYTHPKEYDLNHNFNRYVRPNDPVKVNRFLVHWLLPLAIRMGTGRFDYPKMSLENIQFISSSLISILVPKEVHHDPLPLSFLARFGVQLGTTTETPQSLLNICFLGFKILLTVFPTSFGRHWKEIKKTIETYMEKDESEILLWKFISFVVSTRSTLLVYLLPKIKRKLSTIENVDGNLKTEFSRIQRDLQRPPVINSRSLILQQILQELSVIARKDKETVKKSVTDEVDSNLKVLPALGEREECGGHEDDLTYIKRVKQELAQNQSSPGGGGGMNKQRIGSIIKQPNADHQTYKKQVSFSDGSPNPMKLPRSPGRRREGIFNVEISAPILSYLDPSKLIGAVDIPPSLADNEPSDDSKDSGDSPNPNMLSPDEGEKSPSLTLSPTKKLSSRSNRRREFKERRKQAYEVDDDDEEEEEGKGKEKEEEISADNINVEIVQPKDKTKKSVEFSKDVDQKDDVTKNDATGGSDIPMATIPLVPISAAVDAKRFPASNNDSSTSPKLSASPLRIKPISNTSPQASPSYSRRLITRQRPVRCSVKVTPIPSDKSPSDASLSTEETHVPLLKIDSKSNVQENPES